MLINWALKQTGVEIFIKFNNRWSQNKRGKYPLLSAMNEKRDVNG